MTNPFQRPKSTAFAALTVGFWKEARPPLFKMIFLPGFAWAVISRIIAQDLRKFNCCLTFISRNLDDKNDTHQAPQLHLMRIVICSVGLPTPGQVSVLPDRTACIHRGLCLEHAASNFAAVLLFEHRHLPDPVSGSSCWQAPRLS